MWEFFISLGAIVMLLVEFRELRLAAMERRDLHKALDASWEERKELVKERNSLAEKLHKANVKLLRGPSPEEIHGAIDRVLGRGLVALGNESGLIEILTVNGEPFDCSSLVLRLKANEFPSISIQGAGDAILEIKGISLLAISDPDSIRSLLKIARRPAGGTP